jgi:alpha-beta hydrolase superfamily lysophospholipase
MTGALRATLPAALAVLLFAGMDRSVSAQAGRGTMRTMTIRTTDGRTVTALHAEAEQRPAPAVVLVPMLGRPREDWQPLIERLIAANMSALLVDLPAATAPGESKELASWQGVVQGGVEYLAGRPEVRGGAIGVAGASLGANLAALAAAGDARVRSLALLSASLDYRGVRIEGSLREYGARPALFLSSLKDPYAARSARSLAAGASGLRELVWSEVPAHGTLLLADQPDLARTLVEWFQRTLG